MRDKVKDAQALIGIAIDSLLDVNAVPELAEPRLADAIDHLGAARDALADLFEGYEQ